MAAPASAGQDAGHDAGPAASSSRPHLRMPQGTAGRVLWWGGLATVAAFGVVDWPVAALVAAGSWVAEQRAKQAELAYQAELAHQAG